MARQAYMFYPAGVGQSKLTAKLIEKKLGSPAQDVIGIRC